MSGPPAGGGEAPSTPGTGRSPAERQALRRLRRIEGQIRGLQRMVEEGRDCGDVLTQVASVQQALRSTGKLLLVTDLRSRVALAVESNEPDQVQRAAEAALDLALRHGW